MSVKLHINKHKGVNSAVLCHIYLTTRQLSIYLPTSFTTRSSRGNRSSLTAVQDSTCAARRAVATNATTMQRGRRNIVNFNDNDDVPVQFCTTNVNKLLLYFFNDAFSIAEVYNEISKH